MNKKFFEKKFNISILFIFIATIIILLFFPSKKHLNARAQAPQQASQTQLIQPNKQEEQIQPLPQKINTLKNGVLVIGTNATFPPFEYKNKTGEIDGFDVAFCKIIAKKLGLKAEIIDMEFESLIPSIGSKIDVAVAGITKTPEREQNVSFSDTYFKTKQSVLTLKNKNIKSEQDLNKLTIGTQIGTTASEIASKIPNTNSKNYNTYQQLVNELLNKRLGLVICDESTASSYQALYKDKIKELDGSLFGFPEENYSIACQKGNKEIVDAINNAITEIKNDKGPEGYNELVTKYIKAEVNANIEKMVSKKGIIESIKSTLFENNRLNQYMKGLGITLQITLFSVIIGFFIGIILAILKLTKNRKGKKTIFARLANLYISLIRGTPVVVQLLIFWYVIFKNIKNGVFVAILAFGLNSAAYVAEILRGGVNSVEKGQMEAARSMGFNNIQTMRYVILPQALKNSIPALCNEFISLLKETAVAGYVAVEDLTRVANTISAASFEPFIPLLMAALMYFIITKSVSILLEFIEKNIK